jgi:DNA-binding CsgD family transcriptional regulator
MANHIYILFIIISFCTGMVFNVPSLLWFKWKGPAFKYYNNYKYYFHAITAFTVLIFSNSIYYYISLNIPDAGIFAFISLVTLELISIHMFLVFFPLFIHKFFSVKFSRVLNIIFIMLSALSLISSLIIFYLFYISKMPSDIKEAIISFPVESIYHGIFTVVILYTAIIIVLYFKKLNDDLLQKQAISYLVFILIFFFGIFASLFFQTGSGLSDSINIKIYILPAIYLLFNIIAAYYCVRYYFLEPSLFAAQGFSIERFAKEYDLTSREVEIIKLLINGFGNTEICDELSISLPTVKSHMSNIFRKIGCSRRTELLSIIFHGV